MAANYRTLSSSSIVSIIASSPLPSLPPNLKPFFLQPFFFLNISLHFSWYQLFLCFFGLHFNGVKGSNFLSAKNTSKRPSLGLDFSFSGSFRLLGCYTPRGGPNQRGFRVLQAPGRNFSISKKNYNSGVFKFPIFEDFPIHFTEFQIEIIGQT